MSQCFDDLRRSLIGLSGGNYAPLMVLTVHKKLFLEKYKTLTPIESLPIEEKKDWWEETKKLIPGRSRDETIDGCKVLYTIGNLL